MKFLEAYDEIEVKANYWMERIKHSIILNREKVVFKYNGDEQGKETLKLEK